MQPVYPIINRVLPWITLRTTPCLVFAIGILYALGSYLYNRSTRKSLPPPPAAIEVTTQDFRAQLRAMSCPNGIDDLYWQAICTGMTWGTKPLLSVHKNPQTFLTKGTFYVHRTLLKLAKSAHEPLSEDSQKIVETTLRAYLREAAITVPPGHLIAVEISAQKRQKNQPMPQWLLAILQRINDEGLFAPLVTLECDQAPNLYTLESAGCPTECFKLTPDRRVLLARIEQMPSIIKAAQEVRDRLLTEQAAP